MKIINFKSSPKQTPFAPEWNYFLSESDIKEIDFKKIEEFLKEKEKTILNIPLNIPINKKISSVDGYTNLGKNSTTSRHDSYNIFKWKHKELNKLKKSIINIHNSFLKYLNITVKDSVYIKCWYNVMRKNQSVNIHLHSVEPICYLSGNICVSCNKTSTFYVSPINQINDPVYYESKNKVGKALLFPSNIPHYTNVHDNDEERVTVAFDLVLGKPKHLKHLIKLL